MADVNDVNKPNISLWGYMGWHPVNDYNDMNVINDYNNINPYHRATVLLENNITAVSINTQYLYEGSIINISGAKIKNIHMSGAGRLEIHSGSVDNLSAKDYSIIEVTGGNINDANMIHGTKTSLQGGDINNISLYDDATLIIHGYDFTLANMTLLGKWTTGTTFQITFKNNSPNVILFYSINNITGDYNNDRKINMLDFAIFANKKNKDINELRILSKNWLKEY
jgi:hypothetical protein